MSSTSLPRSRQSAFTLIELMVSMSLTSILTLMSIQSLDVLKHRAYSATTHRTFQNVELAIEAGINSLELNDGAMYMAWTNGDGVIGGMQQQRLVPGLIVNRNIHLFARYDSFCAEGLGGFCDSSFPCCVVDNVTVMNCKGGIARSRMRWNDGTVFEWDWENAAWC